MGFRQSSGQFIYCHSVMVLLYFSHIYWKDGCSEWVGGGWGAVGVNRGGGAVEWGLQNKMVIHIKLSLFFPSIFFVFCFSDWPMGLAELGQGWGGRKFFLSFFLFFL